MRFRNSETGNYEEGEPVRQHEDLFLCERRVEGKLDFGEPQPLKMFYTEWEIAQLYYKEHPGKDLADMPTIYAYFRDKYQWGFRKKTW